MRAVAEIWKHVRTFLCLLRFESPVEEYAFQQQHQKWLPHFAAAMMFLSACLYAAAIVSFSRKEHEFGKPFLWDFQDGRFPTFAGWLLETCVRFFVFAFLLWAKRCRPNRIVRFSETFIVLTSMLTGLVSPLANAWRGPALVGADPQHVWASMYKVEGAELWSVSVVYAQMAVVSAMSIRCSILWVHHVAIATFNVLARQFFDRAFPNVDIWLNLTVMLVAGCSFGSVYRTESFMRQSWTAMRISQDTAEGRQLELEQQKATTQAMRSVLCVSFDVVLQTGQDFVLTGGPSVLSSVMGENHDSSTAGVTLLDNIIPADRDRLVNLAGAASALSLPQLMSTVCVDSSGEHTRAVEVLIADTKTEGDTKYLVGLRVPPLALDNRADRLPSDYRDVSQLQDVQRREGDLRRRERRRADTETSEQIAGATEFAEMDRSSMVSADSGASSCWTRMDIGAGPHKAEVFATIDTDSPNYMITSCSASFASLCTVSALGQGLAYWTADPLAFQQWVQHQVNMLVMGDENDVEMARGLHITLRPPAIVARGLEIRVCAKIALDTTDSTDDFFLVQVWFDRVRWRLLSDTDTARHFFAL